jgi:hypothetical protein
LYHTPPFISKNPSGENKWSSLNSRN